MAPNNMYSVTDLEDMLEQRRAEIGALEERRESLSAELAEVDSRINELNGAGGRIRRSTKKKTKKVARGKKAARRKGVKGKRTQPSLRKVILDVLPRAGKPLPLTEVMDKVLATGYRSNAKDFRQVVYLNLYNLAKKGEINHDSKTKLYSA